MDDDKLSPRHIEFIREYLTNGRNATEAYSKVYPNSKTPGVNASQLLKNPKVSAAIKKEDEKLQQKFEIKREDIVKSLHAIAYFDPMSVLEWKNGKLVYRKDVSEGAMLGANFTIYPDYQTKADAKNGIVKAKLTIMSGDRKGALEALGKHIGMWKNNDPGSGSDKESRANLVKRVHELFRKHKERGRGSGSNNP